MKPLFNAILLTFLLGSFSLSAQIKSGEITYKVKISKDLKEMLARQSKDQSMNRAYQTMLQNLQNSLPLLSYSLKFNEQESLFKSNKTMSIDKSNTSQLAAITAGKGVFYTDLTHDKLIHQTVLITNGQTYRVLRKLSDYNWQITEERKRIKGYLCYKAILQPKTKQKFTTVAWFCPQLPLSFGPSKSGGLPGLILEFHEKGAIIFYADSIKFSAETVSINKPKEGRLITQEDFKRIVMKTLPKKLKRSSRQ